MKIKPSILSLFNLFLNFVMNSPMAENALSGTIDVSLIVSKARYSFSRLSGPFLLPQKDYYAVLSNCKLK